MTEQRNIRLLIEYDGTAYVGWQMQAEHPSVQGKVHRAIERMTGTAPTLIVAGRTDAGVHAVGQVANFKTNSAILLHKFAPGLNYHLPDDISIHRAVDAPLNFSARHDTNSKRYRYRIYQGPQPIALERHRAWHIINPIDTDAMRRGAEFLVGKQDFNSFRSVHCDSEHAERDMFSIEITEGARPPVGRLVEIVFHANAYCRHMCRILAGTLLSVGVGKRSADDIRRIRDSSDRTEAGVTAPPYGLTLLQVIYAPAPPGSPVK